MHRLTIAILVIALVAIASCKKDNAPGVMACNPAMVTDIDGNGYNTVKLGTQCWLQQNLRTAHYRNGTSIPEMEDSATWNINYNTNAQNAGWCYFNGNYVFNSSFGKLYNFYVVADTGELCPAGFHVPTDSDWTVLTNYLGDTSTDGGHMKAITTWETPNIGANNSSGFTALPAGYRTDAGTFATINLFSTFWSSTANGDGAWTRVLNFDSTSISREKHTKNRGFSVRCVGD